MKIKRRSYFKSGREDISWFREWVSKLEKLNQKEYSAIEIQTALGKTHIWEVNSPSKPLPKLVIFPGFRTTSLIWDFENQLSILEKSCHIFLVETNGLPNLSDGNSPDIKSSGYGQWAEEILDKLEIERAIVAGASFGGLITLKLGIVAPGRVKSAILLNPGGLQRFSMKWKNLYLNILPVVSTSRKNIIKFLNEAVFCSPNHQLETEYFNLLVDYQIFALRKYKDHTQKPYYMGKELREVNVDIYLLEGSEDMLFPPSKSISNARKYLKNLRGVEVFNEVGHGIETYKGAIEAMKKIIDTG